RQHGPRRKWRPVLASWSAPAPTSTTSTLGCRTGQGPTTAPTSAGCERLLIATTLMASSPFHRVLPRPEYRDQAAGPWQARAGSSRLAAWRRAAARGGVPGVLGPGVAWVAALQLPAHLRVGVLPEAAQVGGDLLRAQVGGQQVEE